MSVSDPLIKDIKACTLKFLEDVPEKKAITDESQNLQLFCIALENIYNTGLIKQQGKLYFNKKTTPYSWMSSIIQEKSNVISFSYAYCVEKISSHKNVTTCAGKFRLLIRYCLVQKCLHIPLEYLRKAKKNNQYYNRSSIIGDDILLEILLSALLQYSKINFQLDVDNCAFLDEIWLLPTVLTLELVPTKKLGISVSFSEEKAVIVHIENNSVVSEEDSINVGDVLDTLNGHYINSSLRGRLSSLLHTTKKQPVYIRIIKAIDPETNKFYPPIKKLLQNLRMDIDEIKNSVVDRRKESENTLKKINAGYKVTYLGHVEVGKFGDAKLITKGIRIILSGNKNNYYNEKLPWKKIDKEVTFELQDLGIRVLDSESSEMILQHSFMQISSCGSGEFLTNYFAYIAGDDVCNSANNFTCYVFHTKNNEHASFIMQSMGQGFHRTHFAV